MGKVKLVPSTQYRLNALRCRNSTAEPVGLGLAQPRQSSLFGARQPHCPALATTVASWATSPGTAHPRSAPQSWGGQEEMRFNKPSRALLSQGNSHFHHQKTFEGRAQKAFGCPCSVPTASAKCFIDASHHHGPGEAAVGSTGSISAGNSWKTPA